MERYSMSKREIDQIWVMKLLLKGEITQKEASEMCHLSPRQIRRRLLRYIQEGEVGLIHKSREKPSNRSIKPSIIQEILLHITTKYYDFGPTLAAEKLNENHGITIDHETLRRIMIKNGLHTAKKKKAGQRQWREPKHHAGELVQLDGSYHIWFGNQYSTLIVFIDDATKQVFCRFAKESTEGVTQILKIYLKKYGRPLKFYTDNGKVFKVNKAKDLKGKETQFTRMLKELNIEISYAYSPQAKGRVERVNRTLQDRLGKELRLLNITAIDQANAMLDQFLEKFNHKFMVQPKNKESFFRSIDGYDLNSILCYKYKRTMNNDCTIAYKNRWFQLKKKQPLILYNQDKIDVHIDFDGTITLWKKGKKLDLIEISKPVRIMEEKKERKTNSRVRWKPRQNHPWRVEASNCIEDKSKELRTGHF
jgi:Homeodomain-like domain